MAIGSVALKQSTDPWKLRGLLSCALCDQQWYPLQMPGGPRAYRRSCGCGLLSVDAAAVEQLAAHAVREHRPALLEGVADECFAAVYQQLFWRIRLGATGSEAEFLWRV